MTETDQPATSDHTDRLAELAKRRQSPDDHKRAVIGKIVATGLTSTTVFGITAALGWSTQNTASEAPVANTEQLVLDLATGRLITIQNGVPVSAEQVLPAATTVVGQAAPPIAPTDSPAPLVSPISPSSSKGSSTNSGTLAGPVVSPDAVTELAPAAAPSEATVAPTSSPIEVPIQQVEIPIAVPAAPVAVAVPSQGSSSGS